jgi:hypothetical protein
MGIFGELFGEGEQSLEEIDAKIAIYNKHISDLNLILRAGSPEGKQLAKLKLQKVQQDLKTLYDLRSKAI